MPSEIANQAGIPQNFSAWPLWVWSWVALCNREACFIAHQPMMFVASRIGGIRTSESDLLNFRASWPKQVDTMETACSCSE
jgi:hypothetical protein